MYEMGRARYKSILPVSLLANSVVPQAVATPRRLLQDRCYIPSAISNIYVSYIQFLNFFC